MPKFIGQSIPGAIRLEDNAIPLGTERVHLTYSQAKLLPPSEVMFSRDTTDRGGPKSLAKRWNRWFASSASILGSARSTPSMRQNVRQAQLDAFRASPLAVLARLFMPAGVVASLEAKGLFDSEVSGGGTHDATVAVGVDLLLEAGFDVDKAKRTVATAMYWRRSVWPFASDRVICDARRQGFSCDVRYHSSCQTCTPAVAS